VKAKRHALPADSLTRLNATKQAIGFAANGAAAVLFLFSGQVHWPAAVVMLVAAVAGGWLGGRLAGRVRPATLRAVVVTVGGGGLAISCAACGGPEHGRGVSLQAWPPRRRPPPAVGPPVAELTSGSLYTAHAQTSIGAPGRRRRRTAQWRRTPRFRAVDRPPRLGTRLAG
jgi:hypothetical protein